MQGTSTSQGNAPDAGTRLGQLPPGEPQGDALTTQHAGGLCAGARGGGGEARGVGEGGRRPDCGEPRPTPGAPRDLCVGDSLKPK